MGSCCSGNDSVPNSKINVDRKTKEVNQPLLHTDEKKSTEPALIEINKSIIIEHIISLSTYKLMNIWDLIDRNQSEEIQMDRDLKKLFSCFVDDYIKSKTSETKINKKYNIKRKRIAEELKEYFQNTIMINYKLSNTDIMTKDEYMENLQQYFAEPNAPQIASEPEEEVPDYDEIELSPAPPDTQINEQYTETFDMLSYISTSPTMSGDNDFDVEHTVPMLKSAMTAKKKKRGEQVGEILASLTEAQRVEVKHNYVGANNESLQSALEDSFSGDLLLILTELCRSSAYNDAEWIEKSRNKLNINTAVINEILMSRTNTQLQETKEAYKIRFGRDLLESLLQSFNGNGSYANLLKLVLTDDPKILRKEFDPKFIKEKQIRDDAKILYHILENTKGKLNKLKIIEMLCHRSWFHIAALCREYGKKSKYDLRTMIERKFGKNSKSGDALQNIIDVSRNRHSFFAQLLFKSMKGMGTDDDLLIRTVVGRSAIDLGEISSEFSHKYGSGKTLLQFIKGNARKGTYRNILLRICAIGQENANNDLEDDGDTDTTETEEKVFEANRNYSISVDSKTFFDDQKLQELPKQSWEEYIASSPTIVPAKNFNAASTAKELIAVMTVKKQKKDAKKLLINTLTSINNKQRQDLARYFKQYHSKASELNIVTQEILRKGKTMIVMLALLQKPSEFNCFWVKQAIKNRKIELLVERLCSCTNYELQKMKDVYEKDQKTNLMKDIEKSILGSKNTAKYLISKILECKRPEATYSDKRLCKIHLTEMNRLLKEKNAKKCKTFFAKLFAENSYTQIKYEINKFNQASEQTLASVVKKIMGSGYAGIICENIMQISTNRFAYFSQKLRDSMKGISTQEQILIRTLISRSEKDLGDIVQYFAEENYGEGKTLKQWIQESLKGSFRTSLLRIAGVHDILEEDDEDPDDYESQTESDFSATPSRSQSIAMSINSKSQGYPLKRNIDTSSADSSSRDRHATVHTKSTPEPPKMPSPPPTTTKQSQSITIVKNDESAAVIDSVLKLPDLASNDSYDPYAINEEEFGAFIVDKVNEKTAQRLMQHLKQGGGDGNDAESIQPKQCIHVLLFGCVLFLKYKEKIEKRQETNIDKKKLKNSLLPSYNWILQNRLKNKTLKKSNYKILGTWLQEYYQEQKK